MRVRKWEEEGRGEPETATWWRRTFVQTHPPKILQVSSSDLHTQSPRPESDKAGKIQFSATLTSNLSRCQNARFLVTIRAIAPWTFTPSQGRIHFFVFLPYSVFCVAFVTSYFSSYSSFSFLLSLWVDG